MLRLDINTRHVIYNNSEDVGLVETLPNTGEAFCITLSDGTIRMFFEEDCSESTRLVFAAYHEFYKDSGGIAPIIDPPATNDTPTPTLEQQIEDLKQELALRDEVINFILMTMP
jgi:hypothetical protein